MCTAAVYKTKDHYFGRNLDFDISYGEKIAITPRNYPFSFRKVSGFENHYAMIGMAIIVALLGVLVLGYFLIKGLLA